MKHSYFQNVIHETYKCTTYESPNQQFKKQSLVSVCYKTECINKGDICFLETIKSCIYF